VGFLITQPDPLSAGASALEGYAAQRDANAELALRTAAQRAATEAENRRQALAERSEQFSEQTQTEQLGLQRSEAQDRHVQALLDRITSEKQQQLLDLQRHGQVTANAEAALDLRIKTKYGDQLARAQVTKAELDNALERANIGLVGASAEEAKARAGYYRAGGAHAANVYSLMGGLPKPVQDILTDQTLSKTQKALRISTLKLPESVKQNAYEALKGSETTPNLFSPTGGLGGVLDTMSQAIINYKLDLPTFRAAIKGAADGDAKMQQELGISQAQAKLLAPTDLTKLYDDLSRRARLGVEAPQQLEDVSQD